MIHLGKITWENYSICAVGLKLNEKQQTFLGNNELSLVQAYVSSANDEYPWMPFAIYSDDTVIGFTMIFYKPENNELSKESCYVICRFMIADEYQGKGYGREALMKIIEKIKSFPSGEAPAVYLSFKHENIVAKNLFLSIGFAETGEDDEEGCALAKLIL
ncbi:MAG: GNAT family N-acetyltransferase [Oscillospiraceae bacterium]|nr:GNAT family N-acetyltransferase [Oscillospiraceae bacterium]